MSRTSEETITRLSRELEEARAEIARLNEAMEKILKHLETAKAALTLPSPPLPDCGHGHVHPSVFKARCGGPAICPKCARDLAALIGDKK